MSGELHTLGAMLRRSAADQWTGGRGGSASGTNARNRSLAAAIPIVTGVIGVGQTWLSKTHIDCVGRDFDIWFDDEQIMAKGQFLV